MKFRFIGINNYTSLLNLISHLNMVSIAIDLLYLNFFFINFIFKCEYKFFYLKIILHKGYTCRKNIFTYGIAEHI